jgi:Tfp pilus assembly protein PilF
MKFTCIFTWILFASSSLFAQTIAKNDAQIGAPPNLRTAIVEELQGKFEAAIQTLNRVIDLNHLSALELGRACVLLGFAYHQQGEFLQAKAAFEKALPLLAHDPAASSDYAAALNNFAALYGDAGEFDAAAHLWQKALHLRQNLGDHAATMRTLTNLAQVAIAQKQTRKAKKYAAQASAQAALSADITDDDRSVLEETEGWLALREGRTPEAIDRFRSALVLTQQTRGSAHWLTGWEHILLANAFAHAGDLSHAMIEGRQGMAILGAALGQKNLKYFAAAKTYSEIADKAGFHAEAASLRAAADKEAKDFYGTQCLQCTLGIVAFQ